MKGMVNIQIQKMTSAPCPFSSQHLALLSLAWLHSQDACLHREANVPPDAPSSPRAQKVKNKKKLSL